MAGLQEVLETAILGEVGQLLGLDDLLYLLVNAFGVEADVVVANVEPVFLVGEENHSPGGLGAGGLYVYGREHALNHLSQELDLLGVGGVVEAVVLLLEAVHHEEGGAEDSGKGLVFPLGVDDLVVVGEALDSESECRAPGILEEADVGVCE